MRTRYDASLMVRTVLVWGTSGLGVLLCATAGIWAATVPCSVDTDAGSLKCHDFRYELNSAGTKKVSSGTLSTSGKHFISLPWIIDDPAFPFSDVSTSESMRCDDFEDAVDQNIDLKVCSKQTCSGFVPTACPNGDSDCPAGESCLDLPCRQNSICNAPWFDRPTGNTCDAKPVTGSSVSKYDPVLNDFTACDCSGGPCNFDVVEGGGYLLQVPSIPGSCSSSPITPCTIDLDCGPPPEWACTAPATFTIRGREEGHEAVLLGPLTSPTGRQVFRVPHDKLKHQHDHVSDLVADLGGFDTELPAGPVSKFWYWDTTEDELCCYDDTVGPCSPAPCPLVDVDIDLDTISSPRAGYVIEMADDLAYTADFSNRHCSATVDECTQGLECTPCFTTRDCYRCNANPNLFCDFNSDCPAADTCDLSQTCHTDGVCSVQACSGDLTKTCSDTACMGGPCQDVGCQQDADCEGFGTCTVVQQDKSAHFQSAEAAATTASVVTDITLRVDADNEMHVSGLNDGGKVVFKPPTVRTPAPATEDGHNDWIDLGGYSIQEVDVNGSIDVRATATDQAFAQSFLSVQTSKVTLAHCGASNPSFCPATPGTFKYLIQPTFGAGYGVTGIKFETPGGTLLFDCTSPPCQVFAEVWPDRQFLSESRWDTSTRVKLGAAGTPSAPINLMRILPYKTGVPHIQTNLQFCKKSLVLAEGRKACFDCLGGRGGSCTETVTTCAVDTDCDASREHSVECPDTVDPCIGTPASFGAMGAEPELVLSNVILGGVVCGDGIVSGDETCDDGNRVGGDGCPAVCRSASAGSIPSGGAPLLVAKNAGNLVDLSWSASCVPTDSDYDVYEGTLGNFTSHTPRLCTTGGLTTATISSPVAIGSGVYYLVAPQNASNEGSYGLDGNGAERPASVSACLPQSLGSCPP